MRKRVKRLNLNTTKRSHDKLLIKNLFTSLLLYGKLETTAPRARALKSYSLKMFSGFKNAVSPVEKKRWIKAEISTKKYAERAVEKLRSFGEIMKVSSVKVAPRVGDGASQYEVSILNYKKQKANESNKTDKS